MKFRNIYGIVVIFLLCSCATRSPIVQQLSVPIVIQEGNFTYSLFCEKSEIPGRFFVLPILEEQRLGPNVLRLFFRVEVKKQTTQKLIFRGFLRSQTVNGDRSFGTISGLKRLVGDCRS